MKSSMNIALLAVLLAVTSCQEDAGQPSQLVTPEDNGTTLVRIGSEVVTEADLEHLLREKYSGRNDEVTREVALKELVNRSHYTQAARAAGLEEDSVVRAEVNRILASRYRELELSPKIKAVANQAVSESQLLEIYESQKSRFQSSEKREIAVLWLNPGTDPGRLIVYQEKLRKAREWFLTNGELTAQAENGFSTLSVDHSEHAPSRYKGGVVGWYGEGGGMDKWSKAVAQIAFSLQKLGEVSEVITRPEGVFLVRYMKQKPAVTRPFSSVRGELERGVQQARRKALEQKFEEAVASAHSVKWIKE
jgi:hypothetical protein